MYPVRHPLTTAINYELAKIRYFGAMRRARASRPIAASRDHFASRSAVKVNHWLRYRNLLLGLGIRALKWLGVRK